MSGLSIVHLKDKTVSVPIASTLTQHTVTELRVDNQTLKVANTLRTIQEEDISAETISAEDVAMELRGCRTHHPGTIYFTRRYT
jgi:hypothetical protein